MKKVLLSYLPHILLGIMILSLIGAAYFANQWYKEFVYNQEFQNHRLFKQEILDSNPLLALQQAYMLSLQTQTPDNIKKTIHALTIAESSQDTLTRALAKFSVGNLYYDLSAISADIGAGGSHQQAVAQITLAREAYKSAIKLQSEMYEARFNLELLDRFSPEKRTQGWMAETDGVTLQPFKRNGTAMMKDNRRRGLP